MIRNWRLDVSIPFDSKINQLPPLTTTFQHSQLALFAYSPNSTLLPLPLPPHSASHESTTNPASQSSHSTTVILSTPSPFGHGGWILGESQTREEKEGPDWLVSVIRLKRGRRNTLQVEGEGNRRSETVLALYDCFRCIVLHCTCCYSRQ